MSTLRTALVACGISSLIVGGSVSAFVWATYEPPPATEVAESSPAVTPSVSEDSQAEEIARLFTKDRVWVYRWENGLADWSVQFDGEVEQTESPLDDQKAFVAGLRETLERSIAASELSGEVVIVISELPEAPSDDPDHDMCAVRIVSKPTWKSPSGDRSQSCIWEWKGRVKFQRDAPATNADAAPPSIQFISSNGDSEAQIATSITGREPWFRLKVVEP